MRSLYIKLIYIKGSHGQINIKLIYIKGSHGQSKFLFLTYTKYTTEISGFTIQKRLETIRVLGTDRKSSKKNCQQSFSRFLSVEAEVVEAEAEAIGVEAVEKQPLPLWRPYGIETVDH